MLQSTDTTDCVQKLELSLAKIFSKIRIVEFENTVTVWVKQKDKIKIIECIKGEQ